MRLASDSPLIAGGVKPNFLYATGIGSFLGVLGVPASFAVSFGLMAFTTFVYDTLDVCTRLGRYIIEELTGWRTRGGRALAAILTAGVPIPFLLQQSVDAAGKPIPVWRTFWDLFGASNQLLAALTLIGVTVWLWKTRRAAWVFLVTGVPTVVMYVMSLWAVLRIIRVDAAAHQGYGTNAVSWVAMLLVALAVLVAFEAVLVFLKSGEPPSLQTHPVSA
jgi:carbon starvation protein